MKAIKLCLIIVIAAVVINFLRDGRLFHIAKTLPFAGGPERISQYDWAGVIMLIIFLWGLHRLKRNKRQ
jgi:hypothetical protein